MTTTELKNRMSEQFSEEVINAVPATFFKKISVYKEKTQLSELSVKCTSIWSKMVTEQNEAPKKSNYERMINYYGEEKTKQFYTHC